MNSQNHRAEEVTGLSTATDYELPQAATAADLRPETNGIPGAGEDAEMFAAPRTARSAVRITTLVAVSVVAAVAAVVSFMHMYELAARAGEGWRAWLVPLAIDGLVVAASMTMVVRRRAGKKTGWLAGTSVTLGIAASLAANIAAAEPTLIGRTVAAWPPIALLLAYELLMDQLDISNKHAATQRLAPAPTQLPTVSVPRQPAAAHNLAAAPTTAAPTTTSPPPAQGLNDTTPTTGAPNAGLGTVTADAPAPSTVLVAVPDRDENSAEDVRQAARQRYLKTLADGLPCTGRELADMFGMSERWGRYQIRAARRTLTHPVHASHTMR